MSISASWIPLGEQRKKPVFYRKREIYSMEWGSIDLSAHIVAGAPFGGPIAIVRDPKKIVLLNSLDARPRVRIFTSSGRELASFPWERGTIIALGWTSEEKLVVVTTDGSVYLYDIRGRFLKQFSMGPECREAEVLECKIWASGVVCLTETLQLWAVSDWVEPRPIRLSDPGLDARPLAMEVIAPEFTMSGSVEVLVAPKGSAASASGADGASSALASGTILVVDPGACQDMQLTNGPFTKLSASPSGVFLASFTHAGDVCVTSTDFSKNLSEFNTKSRVPPRQLVWCAEDSVVLYWDKEQLRGDTSLLLMIGPYGDYEKFTYESSLHLVPECDGVRIFSADSCEYLQRVPSCTVDIFRIGSLAPAAILYDAYMDFERMSASSVKNIRAIRGELSPAVEACVEAATHEFDRALQGNLLKAASYGKCFLDFHDPDVFVTACRHLRVLNAVFEIGMPLTIEQFNKLSAEVLVDRLVHRHEHLLAFRVCNYLSMKPDRVLIHWACAKVRCQDLEDNDICRSISAKLQQCPGISYTEIAATAFREGRPKLAIMLLDFEPRAAEQVPLLVSMQEDERALVKAVDSGDTDLVYLVLLNMKRKLAPRDLYRMVIDKPVARDLLIIYCKEQDIDFLKAFYSSIDKPHEAANMYLLDSYKRMNEHSIRDRMLLLQMAQEQYASKKDFVADSKFVEEQRELLTIQKELEEATGQRIFLNSSVSDTMFNCLVLGNLKRAEKIKSTFKVADKRYWMLRVRACAETNDWDGLDRLAKEKKSPIGYRPFAEACMERGQKEEAVKYVPKVADAKERVELYLLLSRFQEAADTAFQIKNLQLLQDVYNRCTTANQKTYVEKLANTLNGM